jgi:hypothetical protein
MISAVISERSATAKVDFPYSHPHTSPGLIIRVFYLPDFRLMSMAIDHQVITAAFCKRVHNVMFVHNNNFPAAKFEEMGLVMDSSVKTFLEEEPVTIIIAEDSGEIACSSFKTREVKGDVKSPA